MCALRIVSQSHGRVVGLAEFAGFRGGVASGVWALECWVFDVGQSEPCTEYAMTNRVAQKFWWICIYFALDAALQRQSAYPKIKAASAKAV